MFTLEVLEVGDGTQWEAREREQFYLDRELQLGDRVVLNSNLWPSRPGVNPVTPEMRQRLSAGQRRRFSRPEEREWASRNSRMINSLPRQVERMRTNNPVQYVTPEIRKQITQKITGKRRSAKSRARYAEAARRTRALEDRSLIPCDSCERQMKGTRALKMHKKRWCRG